MSEYIKLGDAINAYNQAVKELVEEEMNELGLCHFTECSFNTTQIMLIARMIENLPTIEVSEDCISREQVRAKLDYISYAEKDPISIAKRIVDNAPSVTPTERTGEWIPVKKVYRTNDVDFPNTHIEWETATEPDDIDAVRCSKCGEVFDFEDARNWCTECGAKMRGRIEQ